MATNLTEFLPLVEIPEVPRPLVIRELREAARGLCRHAEGLLEGTITETVNISDEQIILTPPADHAVVAVERVELDSGKLTFLTKDEMRSQKTATAGKPGYYTTPERGIVEFDRPSEFAYVNGLVSEVALMPSKTCTAVADTLYEEWDIVIAAGAMARLYALPRKPWTDIGQSKYHHSEFRTGKGRAAAYVLKSKNNHQPLELLVPGFGGLM